MEPHRMMAISKIYSQARTPQASWCELGTFLSHGEAEKAVGGHLGVLNPIYERDHNKQGLVETMGAAGIGPESKATREIKATLPGTNPSTTH